MLTYVVDIDGVICSNTYGKYNKAKPYKKIIKKINKMYYNHNTIVYFTARGSTTGINWTKLTKKQLKEWGCKYHKLIMGKPEGNFYIDDRAINSKDFFK